MLDAFVAAFLGLPFYRSQFMAACQGLPFSERSMRLAIEHWHRLA